MRIVLAALALAACTSPSTDITVKPISSDPVNGNSFACTGTWPSQWTPCEYGWQSTPTTFASDDGNGLVHLYLERSPIPVDGGASLVHIDLQYGVEGQLSATAYEDTSRAGPATTVETSDPIDGWIQPYVTGRSTQFRNAGTFSITFAWGSISGTYDTNP